MVNQTTS